MLIVASFAAGFSPSTTACQADMSRLESIAQAASTGHRPDGRCYSHVADYIDKSGYGGISKGGFDSAIPSQYWSEAHQFADYLNQGGNAARLSLKKLGLTNPYEAPAGAIVVVRAGTPGTVNPTAGDIAVKGSGGASFYNGGEMGYGGSSNFPPGNDYVLGIYTPTKCSGGGPSPPSPSGGCKACVAGGGGKACGAKCSACGSTCTSCIAGGGGKACAARCCDGTTKQAQAQALEAGAPRAAANGTISDAFVALLRGDVEGSSCSAVGDCGRSYQTCCIAFGAKGYPCGCHLQDGSGTAGSNCGDCGTEFAACCIGFAAKGYPCKCSVA